MTAAPKADPRHDPLRIPLTQDRAVWLFALDLPEDAPDAEVDAFVATGLAPALGLDRIDPAQVEVIDTKTIKLIGLSRYLVDANGMDDEAVGPDAAHLDALTGRLLLVFRAALGPGGVVMDPAAPLRFVAHYAEPGAARMPMPPTPSAQGVLEGPRAGPSDAAMSGRVAMAVLVFLFIFTAVFVWMAS